MSKGNFWKNFLYFFIEKPKNKQNIIQKDEEDEELEAENKMEEVEELNTENQVEVLNVVNPMEEVEEPIEQEQIKQKIEEEKPKEETEENVEKYKEYTTVDYNAMLEKQEERIKNTNYTESEKQQMIDELYKNFETYVGETNNSKKTR